MKKFTLILLPTLLLCSCNQGAPELIYKNYEVITFQPYFSSVSEGNNDKWPLPEGFTNYNQLLKGAGDYLKDKLPSITFKEENISRDETLKGSLFQRLGPNQIILFEGHGSFDPWFEGDTECHSVMWTGRDYNDDDEKKPEYKDDYDNLRLIHDFFKHEQLTSEFIDYYCGDLTGSIVYLGNCYSGRDCTFAQSFLNKGALAVIGNSHTTQAFYNSCVEYTTIKLLADINPDTKKTYTLYEAQCVAKEIYGKNDKVREPVSYGSEPFIFGNPNFCLSDFKK